MFALKLFGGLSLEGGAVAVPTEALQRRRLALLALLALGGRRGLARERIQVYLWPDSPSDRSRHALDQLLYATRRALGHDIILSSTTDLRLNPDRIQSDIVAFDEAIRAERWSDAVDQHTGLLLDGVQLIDNAEFEQWLDAERLRREQDRHRALESLARAATVRGVQPDAVHWWRLRAASDPLNAAVALELMRALAAAGNPAGARLHARLHQQTVRSTLEIEPDPAVEALRATLAKPRQRSERDERSTLRVSGQSPAATVPDPNALDGALETSSPVVDAPVALSALMRGRSRLSRLGIVLLPLGIAGAALLMSRQFNAAPTTASSAPGARAGGDSIALPVLRIAASVGDRTADPQAHSLYLRARVSWNRRTKTGLEQAVVLYRLASERDPTYAAAYSGLAESYAMLGYFGFAPADAMFPKATAAARRALELDPSAAEAYAALGQAFAWQYEWTDAENAYLRALKLAPDDPTVHQWYGLLLAYLGRHHEAAMQTAIASRLDPLSVQINNMYGVMLYYDGNLAGALRQYERTVNAEPDSAWVRQNPWVLTNFAGVAAAAGRYAEALRLLERALQIVPSHPRAVLELAYVYILIGDTGRARDAFARADTTHPHYIVYRGFFHAYLGETDQAYAWFDRVKEWPLAALVKLNGEPRLATLRADPRFERILIRLRMRRR